MRNRAKCRLCDEVIESLHGHHYVSCKCKEIAIDGGKDSFKCLAKNWDNFIRINDEGNEVIPKIKNKVSKEEEAPILKEVLPQELSSVKLTTKGDLVNELKGMLANIEQLPPQAMNIAINHYDLSSLLMLLVALFESDLRDSS